MSSSSRKATLSLTKRKASINDTFIDCILHAAPADCHEFSRSRTPRLVFEPSRPTMVGWRWDHDPVGPDNRHGSPEPSSLEFTYRPDPKKTVRALFPEERSSYQVEAEIDAEGRTIWFPLPTGNCVYLLGGVLGMPYRRPLAEFVQGWLLVRFLDTCEFFVDMSQSDSTEDGFVVVFNGKDCHDDKHVFTHIMIPGELLQDPIANGSKRHGDGFNLWNKEQRDRIVAFLDPHFPRLVSFFETTAKAD